MLFRWKFRQFSWQTNCSFNHDSLNLVPLGKPYLFLPFIESLSYLGPVRKWTSAFGNLLLTG